MRDVKARAEVAQLRQETQFTCCATSIAAALRAHGKDVTEADVNKVLGASPMAGASWEAMLATVQYFGCRGTLVVPSTPRMLKAWTDAGVPVVIAWNPENRPWSHASCVFDVTEGPDGLLVHVMDPNIPNPSRTTRVVGEDEFCQKWGEKVGDALIVRRPAMAVEREVTADGRQVVAKDKTVPVVSPKDEDPLTLRAPAPSRRDLLLQQMIEHPGGTGTHHTRDMDVSRGRSRKDKHKRDWRDREAQACRVAAAFLGEEE